MRWLKWVGAAALIALLVGEGIYLWPRLHESWAALVEIHWGFLAATVAAQAVSLAALARVQKQLLRAGDVEVTQRRSRGVVYASTAMALTLPAGQVFSTAFTYRETRRWGASPVVASWQLVISGVVATCGLAVLGLAGAVVVGGSANVYALALPVAAIVALTAAFRYVRKHPDSIASASRWVLRRVNALRGKPAKYGSPRIDEILDQLQSVSMRKRDLVITALFSSVHRLGDVVCLGLSCYSVGVDPRWAGLLLVFSAAKTVGSIPGAPGGLVLVDATLIATLTTAASMSASQAVASALVYRLVSFVLVALAGWIVILVIFRGHRHDDAQFDLEEVPRNNPDSGPLV